MSDTQLTVTLRQHTPILHFQHNQSGATLRATEVKPKLDRLLIKKLGKEAVKAWLIGDGSQEALDYKIRFVNGKYRSDIPLGTQTKNREGRTKYFTDPEMFPQALANMGGKDSADELKHFRMYETVRMEIFSFHADLLSELKKIIPAFFATHNFGNRQSKGFGSFYLDLKDPLYLDPVKALRSVFKESLVYWAIEPGLLIDDLFSDIDILYRMMKSGFNFPDHPMRDIGGGKKAPDFDRKQEFATYQPSFIKNYFLDKYKIGSEKRAIKESLFRPDVRIKDDNQPKNYIRAILGTAEFFEYRDKDRKGIVNIESDTVERFQSAVTFKVFADKVVLLPGDWSAIRGKVFRFATERDRTPRPIKVPEVNFDLATFLVDYAAFFNAMKGEEIDRLDEIITDLGRRRPTPKLIKDYLNCLENVELKTLTNDSAA